MSWGRIKLRPADTLFSRYLRLKIGHCEVCHRKGEGEEGIKGLVVSHFHGRRNENTRHSEENCDITCVNCHRLFHKSPAKYVAFKIKKLGLDKYKLLELSANTYCKRDDKKTILYLKKLMKKQQLKN